MKFTDQETTFELSIVGYQFPNAVTEPYDSNWLFIRLYISTSQGIWDVTDPCMLTYEANGLAKWLKKIHNGDFLEMEYDFLEPVIKFDVIDDSYTKFLRVILAHEALPPWANGQDEYCVIFALSELDLSSASESLQKQLSEYPQRTVK